MIDTDKYEGHLAHLDYELWAFTDFMNINATHEERCATDALLNDAPLLLEEVERLREENKKQMNALSTLDEMIRKEKSHVKLMKALEQELGLKETWKEMIE